MTIFAQSIKRLYDAGKLTAQEVQARYNKRQITEKEYLEIVED